MMNIEQIADSVSQEMLMHVATLQPELVKWNREYLRRCLEKLAEQDVEPVADVVWFDPATEPFKKANPHKIIDGSLSFMDEAMIGTKLYTEAQLIAAQQNAAHKAGEVMRDRCSEYLDGDECFAYFMGSKAPGSLFSEAIRAIPGVALEDLKD